MTDSTITIEFFLRPKLKRLAVKLNNCQIAADKDRPSIVILNKDSTPDDIRLLLYFFRTAKTYRDPALYLNGRISSKQQAESIILALQCRTNNIDGLPARCCMTADLKGWGCKCLYAVQRHRAFGVYRGIDWYRVGPFENGIQYIDKADIKSILTAESENKALDLCPFFSLKKALALADELPEQIDPRIDADWIYSEDEKGSPVGVEPKEVRLPFLRFI